MVLLELKTEHLDYLDYNCNQNIKNCTRYIYNIKKNFLPAYVFLVFKKIPVGLLKDRTQIYSLVNKYFSGILNVCLNAYLPSDNKSSDHLHVI